MGRFCSFTGSWVRCHGAGDEGRVDQGVLEGMVPAEGGQGRGGEYVSGGGILLEMAEMVSDGLLNMDTGGMVGKDKGNPNAVVGGKRRGEGGNVGDGLDLIEGPVDNGAGESLVEEEGGHFADTLVKVGLMGTDVTETEELREWDR
eukprot:g28205.t1